MVGSTSFQLGKFLVVLGVWLVLVGLLVMAGSRVSWLGLGRLPGDIAYKRRNFQLYFPLASCLVLSVALTLVVWLVSLLTRR